MPCAANPSPFPRNRPRRSYFLDSLPLRRQNASHYLTAGTSLNPNKSEDVQYGRTKGVQWNV
jgi:hypothetical protein